MEKTYFFTSESVTPGHPDKVCDVISDAVLDAYLKEDPDSRVACEVTATTGIITVMGEITSKAVIDIQTVVRETLAEIGYNDEKFGFNSKTCAVMISMGHQSEDIAMGVDGIEKNLKIDEKDRMGAGDQGMMFGYACNETDEYMPAPIYYAHKLCKRLEQVRRDKTLPYLGADGKSMVTFEYGISNEPVSIETVVISTHHIEDIDHRKLEEDIIHHVIKATLPEELITHCKIFVNPTGRFLKGGPCADTGLTGRKIIVDTYGGMGRHGGGAFSGKDPSKVDRTGAYAARYIAKHIVALGMAKKCEVQISYAIGIANPVSININTFGTGKISDGEIVTMIEHVFDLRPSVLIENFQLKNPIYKQLSAYGHFGRNDLDLPWERIDRMNEINRYLEHRN